MERAWRVKLQPHAVPAETGYTANDNQTWLQAAAALQAGSRAAWDAA
jgi:hypothetical protein